MPGTALEVATLDAETTDPLAEVLAQVEEGKVPVMVLGLERAVPMASDDAPILRALNLERSEWAERLRRPVVFWIPEALLSALGRTAPDFLDWRSDTLHFPVDSGRVDRELAEFNTSLWRGALEGGMSERDRRARIEELRSRLRLTPPSDDPTVARARGSWFFELGDHFLFFGELDTAQEHYEKSKAIGEDLGYRRGLAVSYHHLGMVAEQRSRYKEAWDCYRKSLALLEELGDRQLLGASYHQFGNLAYKEGSYDQALRTYRKSLAIKEEIRDQKGMAVSYHQLGTLALKTGRYQDAANWYGKSLAIDEELGNRTGVAANYSQLGRLAQEAGRFEEALSWYSKSLEISEDLGHGLGIGLTSGQVGDLLTETGRAEEAVPWSLRALTIRREMGGSEIGIHLRTLRRQREALGDERFRELVEEHAESPNLAAHVLEATAELLDEPAQEVAEAPADYGAGGRSDGDD